MSFGTGCEYVSLLLAESINLYVICCILFNASMALLSLGMFPTTNNPLQGVILNVDCI